MTAGPPADALPASVDLTPWCSPVERQGSLNACAANAAVSLYEYFERRAKGTYVEGSRLFVYKTARDLMHWTGDSGAPVRAAIRALVRFGLPPEECWPYDPVHVDTEPPAFCYAYGENFKAVQYVRLDPAGVAAADLVGRVKTYLARNFPAAFGLTVYRSIDQSDAAGKIPMPADGDRMNGGHALVAVGYDDAMVVVNAVSGVSATGAIKVRNSWGTGWGDNGYGWLPYDYVTAGLTHDWWTLVKREWVDSPSFTAGAEPSA